MPKCPEHHIEMMNIPIQKADKVIGKNFFCPKRECRFEIDKRLSRKDIGG